MQIKQREYKCSREQKWGAKVKRLSMKKLWKRNWQLFILLLPAVIYLFLFNYKPMYGVQIAFRNFSPKKGIWGSDWVGIEYFLKFVKQPNFRMLIKNTLIIGVYNLATFPCPIIFALLLNELRNQKFKKTVQMISYMPYFLSTVVVCSMISLFFKDETGIFNLIIKALGGESQDFMTIPEYFADIYVWSGEWQSLGFSAIIYIAGLAGVPSELLDAAKIDGAGKIKIIWYVNIPWIMPTIVIMLILKCGGILSVGFEKIFLLQNSLNLSASQVISTYVYEIGMKGGQFSYSTAIGLFNNIISVIMLAIVNGIAKKTTGNGVW
ncbi:MAG: sugar ABC transporter permease [Lachnospiraceae bacterium]|nr:sugar ABC transporter permease [Lachnospiraceae bacterium]